jgi:hypothetical protein
LDPNDVLLLNLKVQTFDFPLFAVKNQNLTTGKVVVCIVAALSRTKPPVMMNASTEVLRQE